MTFNNVMYRILYIFLLCILFQTALCQNENKMKKPMLQIESGISFSSFVNGNSDSALFKVNLPLTPRYYIGISLCVPIFKGLGVKTGLFYDQKGVKAYYKGTNAIDNPRMEADEIEVDFNLLVQNDYFSIPIGFTYNLKHKVSIFVEGGCHFDILNKSSYEYKKTIIYYFPYYPHSYNLFDYHYRNYQKALITRKFDYGPYIGASIGYEFSTGIGIVISSKCELGVLTVDAVNHNERTYSPLYGLSSKDYYGISSDSKNISIKCGLQVYFRL